MSSEVMRETIVLNRDIGRETMQLLLEGEMIVPDVKPDMAVVLKTEAGLLFDRTDASDGRVGFAGRLQIRVLYAARGEGQSVQSMTFTAPFDDFVNMENVGRDMWVGMTGRIADAEYRLLNDRKMGYRIVADVEATAEAREEHEVVTTIAGLPDNRLKHADLTINRTVECKESRFTIKDDLPVPPGKPNIREILQTSVTVANKEVKVAGGRVNVSGELIIATLYRGDTDDSPMDFIEHELPFSGAIDITGAREGMAADAVLHVAETFAQAKPDADGEDRILDMEAAIAASVKVTSQSELCVLEDAYCANKQIAMTKESVCYPRPVTRSRSQCAVKELVTLPEGKPGVLQICRVTGETIVDSVEVQGDRIVAEGVIKADILYIAQGDTPLDHAEALIPFKHVLDARNAQPGMDAAVEPSIDHVGFNMLSANEVELRFLLGLNAIVTDSAETEVITDVAFFDVERSVLDAMPGIVIYTVQKGDTLWSIAKRFNADIDEIVCLNEIEDPNLIFPGQRVLVLKKICE